jgi:hypothetical protein
MTCLDARFSGCLIVYLLALSVPDASRVFCTRRCWAIRALATFIAPLLALIAFRYVVKGGGRRGLSPFTSMTVLCQAWGPLRTMSRGSGDEYDGKA